MSISHFNGSPRAEWYSRAVVQDGRVYLEYAVFYSLPLNLPELNIKDRAHLLKPDKGQSGGFHVHSWAVV